MIRSRMTMWRCAAAVSLAALASPAVFAQAPSLPSSGAPGVMTLLLNLALVLGIIAVCAFIYARGQSRFSAGNSELDIVASRQVGNRERLVVLQVGEEQVLVGITAHAINHIHTLSSPIAVSDTTTIPFAKRLRQFSQGRSNGSENR